MNIKDSKADEELAEGIELEEYNVENKVFLKTHDRISVSLSGEIELLEDGYVETRLVTTNDMLADSHGLVHGGFIFSGADYAGMAAVNEKNVVLVAADIQFLSPVKVHDEVVFKAKVRHKEGRKRNVHVEGFVFDIKVFEGELKTVVTERHVLKLQLTKDENEEDL